MKKMNDEANAEGLLLLKNSLRKVLTQKSNQPSETFIVIFGASVNTIF